MVPPARPRLDVLADPAAALPGQRRGDRLGHRRHPSRVRGPRRRRRSRSSAARRYRDDQGHGTFVAGEIAAEPVQRPGHRRPGVQRAADDRQGRRAGRRGLAAGRGRGDPLGGRQRRARDQPQPRRRARPARPELDTYSPLEQAAVEYAYSKGVVVVAAVGNGPQSPATPWGFAHYPASLPHVIGVSAVRAGRVGARLLEPRRRLQRPRGARAARSSRRSRTNLVEATSGLRRRAVLGLRPVRVPRRDRHVVRGAAGLGRRRAAPRPGPDAPPGAGRVAARAQRRRRQRRDRLHEVPDRPRPVHRLGHARRRERPRPARRRGPCRPSTTTSRTTTPGPGRTRCRRCRTRSRRRSTTGTTTSTSTASTCRRAARLFARVTPAEPRHACG